MQKDTDIPDIEDDNIYDKSILDTDNLDYTETKINPQFYIHYSLIKAINALSVPDIKAGIMQFKILVDLMEGVAMAGNLLPTDYQTKVDTHFKNIKETDEFIKIGIMSRYKMQEILTSVFKNKTITNPLKT